VGPATSVAEGLQPAEAEKKDAPVEHGEHAERLPPKLYVLGGQAGQAVATVVVYNESELAAESVPAPQGVQVRSADAEQAFE
jgi:hypothetical protein